MATLDVINDLIFVAIKMLVLSGSVLMLAANSRDSSADNLYRVLLFTLLACVLIPLLSRMLPQVSIAILPEFVATAARFELSDIFGRTWRLWSPITVTLALYGMVTAYLLAKLIADLWQLQQLEKRCRVIPSPNVAEDAKALLQLSSRPIRLLRSSELKGPISWGYFRPKIALPEDYAQWPSQQLRHVLMHEIAHIKRRDWVATVFAHIVIALFWPVPSLWALRTKLFWYAELASDNWVLRSGVSRTDYATTLLYFANVPQDKFSGNHLMHSSQAFQRIDAVLDGARIYQSSPRPVVAFVVIGLILLVPTSALQLTPLQPNHVGVVRLLPMHLAEPAERLSVTPPAENGGIDLQQLKAELVKEHALPITPSPNLAVDTTPQHKPLPAWQPESPSAPLSLPFNRVSQTLPIYPQRALERGRQGEVTVEFDITPSGTVTNERVVAATPAQVFDEAALQALRQFRYSPRYEEGRAVKTHRVREVFRFELHTQ